MVTVKTPDIHSTWQAHLAPQFEQSYFRELKQFLLGEKKQYRVFPPGSQMFAALNRTPLDQVKAVIIGQDPYHGYGQANGLCFSVSDGIKPPPSLQNIFKEIHADLGCAIPQSGNLESWADQGVLLLNASLSVRERTAGSHQKKGWEPFTNAIIKTVSQELDGVVFLLWGKFAQNKAEQVDSHKHHILQAAHPSPFSAHNGFFGCKHFSRTNDILLAQGKAPIKWQLE